MMAYAKIASVTVSLLIATTALLSEQIISAENVGVSVVIWIGSIMAACAAVWKIAAIRNSDLGQLKDLQRKVNKICRHLNIEDEDVPPEKGKHK